MRERGRVYQSGEGEIVWVGLGWVVLERWRGRPSKDSAPPTHRLLPSFKLLLFIVVILMLMSSHLQPPHHLLLMSSCPHVQE